MKYNSKYEKNQTRLVPNDDNNQLLGPLPETSMRHGLFLESIMYYVLGSYVVVSILY